LTEECFGIVAKVDGFDVIRGVVELSRNLVSEKRSRSLIDQKDVLDEIVFCLLEVIACNFSHKIGCSFLERIT